MKHTAEIIGVGTELLLGKVANTDAKDLSQMLSEIGIDVFYHTVVGDNPQRLRNIVEIAKKRADIIITTGGLGPTCDDLTKQILAESFGKKLEYNEKAAATMMDYFKNVIKAKSFTENNLRQAMLPEGCTVFHNKWGTAPGCAFEAEGVRVLMLPGPPRECVAMFRHCGMPYLTGLSEGEIVSHNLHVFGLGESAMEDKLHDMMENMKNPSVAPYAKEGECFTRVTAKAATAEEAEKLMEPVIAEIRERLGSVIYSTDIDSLERTVLTLLTEQGKTLATAESCTGGLVSSRITAIPGSSAAFLGGVATYSNESKTILLGVDPKLIKEQGAVCRDVAIQMASGVREKLGSDIGIGITGIAGPSSDGTDKAVGTVFVAMNAEGNVYCRDLHLGTERFRNRTAAANHALDMVRRYLTGIEVENIR